MVAWIMTALLAGIVARIVYLEKKSSQRHKDAMAKTNAQIESITKNATILYRSKYGEDPVELKATLRFKTSSAKNGV